jgi:hypothetical protein
VTALQDAADFTREPRLREPITAAVVSAAVAIMAEEPDTAGHTERIALAYYLLQNPAAAVDRFVWPMSSNASLVASWASGDIAGAVDSLAYVVGTLWDAVAGVALS